MTLQKLNSFIIIISLPLAAKCIGRGVTAIFGDFCSSICCNPPMLNGKGHLQRESTHLRYTRHKRNYSYPAQWCPSVFTWPCITSAT